MTTRRAFLAVLACMFGLSLTSIAHADALSDLATLEAQVKANAELLQSQTALLVSVLDSVHTRINQGNTAAAKLLLNRFNSYVATFVTEGYLDPVTGQDWINEADTIIAEL